jgi:formylglycine-generating enzyme required for sulfatase activity
MADGVQPIFELGKKIRGLMDWATRANSELTSIQSIARAAGINRSTLNSNIRSEQMSAANQQALAGALGFRVDWPEWFDPSAPPAVSAAHRRDSAEAFLSRFARSKLPTEASPRMRTDTASARDDSTLVESVAPKPRLAAELKRVAESAQNVVDELKKTNLDDAKFPKQRLTDIAATMIRLPAGSENGALPALEYAEGALNDIRFAFVEIADDDQLPDVPRGGRIDQALQTLISDIGTAKRFYSQSRLDAAAKSELPESAQADSTSHQRDVAGRAQDISEKGLALANDLDKSAAQLAHKGDPDQVKSENLARRSRDVANLAKQEAIEIGADRPRIAWLEKLDRGFEVALRSVELTAGMGKITVRKIGEVLIKHVEDWFTGAREWAEETRELIATMKRKWQVDADRARKGDRPDQPFRDFSTFRDIFRDRSGQGPELVVIPAGEFMMGSATNGARLQEADHAFDDEIVKGRGKRPMRIERRFALGCYPVTFEEYDAFLAATAGRRARGRNEADDMKWGRGRRPAINVSWQDARAYCDWLDEMTGLRGEAGYRLPSEAEWEYACRAGTQTRRWWGNDWDPSKANGNGSFEDGRTSPVDHYAPNPWGLHDMIGNVWEWCADHFAESISGLPDGGAPYQTSQGGRRVQRGGSWFSNPRYLRSAIRYWDLPDLRGDDFGFRVARTL